MALSMKIDSQHGNNSKKNLDWELVWFYFLVKTLPGMSQLLNVFVIH